MATAKFKEGSLYESNVVLVDEDYLHKKFLDNITLKNASDSHVFGIALFGAGRAGTFHLPNLVRNPRVNLIYIVEDDTSKWDNLRKYWNLTSTKLIHSKDAEVVFAEKEIVGVVIASPTKTHEQFIMKALDSGKYVLCEKPVTEFMHQTKKCLEKAVAVGKPLLAAFNRLHDPVFDTIRNRVRNGDIGHVISMKITSKNHPLPPLDYLKASNGIFHDTSIHDIDIMLHVLGEYPTKVYVMGGQNVPEIAEMNDYDYVAILFWFPSGTIGIVDVSRYSSFGYDQRMEVFGTKGLLKADNQQPIPNVEFYTTPERLVKLPLYASFPSRYTVAYENEMEHFLDVLQDKATVKVSYEDIMASSKIASACVESAKTGKAIAISWTKEELPHSQK